MRTTILAALLMPSCALAQDVARLTTGDAEQAARLVDDDKVVVEDDRGAVGGLQVQVM